MKHGSLLTERPEPDATEAQGKRPVNLAELFLVLTRVKRSLWAAVDIRLRAEHGLALEEFQAMTTISEPGQSCSESTLASAMVMAPDNVRTLIDALVASQYVTRVTKPGVAQQAQLTLTPRARFKLARAERTFEAELANRLRSSLAPDEVTQLENALASMFPDASGGVRRGFC
jgi:MarR family transcriptional regulator, organic hydroperoxide resistance regulator